MTHPGLLRLSLLSLVLISPSFGARANATAPPAAPPDNAKAVEEQKQAEAEKQAKAEAEKKKQAAAEKQKKIDTEKQKQTVADIRNLGTALFSWLTDQVEATEAEQAENGTSGAPPPRGSVDDSRQKTIDIQDYPLVSREDLEDFLVPQYIAAIPETDAWGNPYEVRLNTDNLMAKSVMSIRSPGRKGYYSGEVYKIEGFDPTDFDQDLVWADGFFVRWPLAAPPTEKPRPRPAAPPNPAPPR
ncbi:MAG TPA: hypothetical protein VLX28_04360 [Thermoanaerobaculia bacterium]|nr:hypothetical protein [Thermoanaerobaculia bacterium]